MQCGDWPPSLLPPSPPPPPSWVKTQNSIGHVPTIVRCQLKIVSVMFHLLFVAISRGFCCLLLRGSTAESRSKALTRNTMTPHTMTPNTNCTRGPFRLFLNSLVALMPLLEGTSSEGLVWRRWSLALPLFPAFVALAAGAH